MWMLNQSTSAGNYLPEKSANNKCIHSKHIKEKWKNTTVDIHLHPVCKYSKLSRKRHPGNINILYTIELVCFAVNHNYVIFCPVWGERFQRTWFIVSCETTYGECLNGRSLVIRPRTFISHVYLFHFYCNQNTTDNADPYIVFWSVCKVTC